ncbi:MAG: hypothetical protein ABL928_09895 [Sphingorhabdus sp.]
MSLFSVSCETHEKLAHLRRRLWTAIGLCFAFQIGAAALHANETGRDSFKREEISAPCPVMSISRQSNHHRTSNTGNTQ